MTLHLYTGPLSMFGMKVEIALCEKGLQFERIEVPYSAALGYAPKHPEVVRINPKQQVPVLLDGDVELFDSTQIFEYLEDTVPAPNLWPRAPRPRAMARQLEHAVDELYFPHVIRLMGLQGHLTDPVATAARQGCDEFHRRLNVQVQGRDYLLGDYTYADIAFFMAQLFGERHGAVMGSDMQPLLVWRHRIAHRSAVKPIMLRFAQYLQTHQRSVPVFLTELEAA